MLVDFVGQLVVDVEADFVVAIDVRRGLEDEAVGREQCVIGGLELYGVGVDEHIGGGGLAEWHEHGLPVPALEAAGGADHGGEVVQALCQVGDGGLDAGGGAEGVDFLEAPGAIDRRLAGSHVFNLDSEFHGYGACANVVECALKCHGAGDGVVGTVDSFIAAEDDHWLGAQGFGQGVEDHGLVDVVAVGGAADALGAWVEGGKQVVAVGHSAPSPVEVEIAVGAVAVAHEGVTHAEVLTRIVAGGVGGQGVVDIFLPVEQGHVVAVDLCGALAVAEVAAHGAGNY